MAQTLLSKVAPIPAHPQQMVDKIEEAYTLSNIKKKQPTRQEVPQAAVLREALIEAGSKMLGNNKQWRTQDMGSNLPPGIGRFQTVDQYGQPNSALIPAFEPAIAGMARPISSNVAKLTAKTIGQQWTEPLKEGSYFIDDAANIIRVHSNHEPALRAAGLIQNSVSSSEGARFTREFSAKNKLMRIHKFGKSLSVSAEHQPTVEQLEALDKIVPGHSGVLFDIRNSPLIDRRTAKPGQMVDGIANTVQELMHHLYKVKW